MNTLRLFLGALAVSLVLSTCGLSPRKDPTIFLVLAPGAAAIPMPAIARGDLRVGVGPVIIPSYLDRPQLVTRVTETELDVNEFARWASPLDELIAETVGANLLSYLALGDVVQFPWARAVAPNYGVSLTLLRFEASAADSVELAGRWEIRDGAGAGVAGPTSVELHRAAEPGPQGVAVALSALLARLSSDIADALRNLPGN
jgi:uncharacterized lipoprotein YmbA